MSRFTQKHYNIIAGLLASEYEAIKACQSLLVSGSENNVLWYIAQLSEVAMIGRRLAVEIFKPDNKKFDAEHFIAVATGVKPVGSLPPRKKMQQ